MAEEQVTTMKLKVNLHCCECFKKIKKILCEFHQIREQEYDEKQGLVIIKVVCCNPEKLRDKLYCKGGGCICRIDIVKPEKPGPESDSKSKPESTPHPQVCVPIVICCGTCQQGPCQQGRCQQGQCQKEPCHHGCGRPPCHGCSRCRPCSCHRSTCDQCSCHENSDWCAQL